MPTLNRACRNRYCPNSTTDKSGFCVTCKPIEMKRYEQQRGNATTRGYNYRWRKYSKRRLKSFPLCAECQRNGKVKAAVVTDHIIPHKGDMVLFWDFSNHQSLCLSCHNRKTANEDGGFGR